MNTFIEILTEVDHAFKQFVFECMNLTTANEDGYVQQCDAKRKPGANPWDDPYLFFLGKTPPGEEEEVEEVKETAPEPDTARSGEVQSFYKVAK